MLMGGRYGHVAAIGVPVLILIAFTEATRP